MSLSSIEEPVFPNLAGSGYRVTSSPSFDYNCIAWSADVTDKVWWPSPGYFWPDNAPRELTVQAFVIAFETIGYVKCKNGVIEPGYEKVAIYAKPNGAPTHAARQLEDGRWTSKLGRGEDIAHPSPENLASDLYGAVAVFMWRARQRETVSVTVSRRLRKQKPH